MTGTLSLMTESTSFRFSYKYNISDMKIPDSIPKTDYYGDGIPRSEIRSKQQSMGMCWLFRAVIQHVLNLLIRYCFFG